MHKIDKIQNDYKQLGLLGFVKHILKYFLRKIGFRINVFNYMVNYIDESIVSNYTKPEEDLYIKKLSIEDFYLGDRDVFNEKKLNIIKERLKDEDYVPYGILTKEGKLVFSCWMYLGEKEYTDSLLRIVLEKDEVLLLDAYCTPSERGRGFQTVLTKYRLKQAVSFGKTKAIAIVLTENRPSYRCQTKLGFKTEFTYYVATIWGKTYTNYFKRKKTYRENAGK